MKRIIISAIVLLSAAFLFVSCGGGGKKVIVPANTSVSGPLGPYFKVVDRSYKIINGEINVEFERIAEGLPSPWTEGMKLGWTDNSVEPGFIIDLLDEDGDVLSKDETSIIWNDDEIAALVALNVGETATIPFTADSYKSKIAKFKISSSFEYHSPSDDLVADGSESTGDDASDISSALNEVASDYSSALNDVASEYSSVISDVADEYGKVLQDAQEEVAGAMNEAAKEVENTMKDALKGLF